MIFLATNSIPLSSLSALTLYFSPVRVLVLIAWVYLCMYCVQRLQFGGFVSNRYKTVASFFTLLAGPIALLLFTVVNVSKKCFMDHRGFGEVLKETVVEFFEKLRKSMSNEKKNDIVLLDSAGNSFEDAFKDTKNRKQRRHVLELTEQVIYDGIMEEASDILIDPKSDGTSTVRFRVDGILRVAYQIEQEVCSSVVSSIKVLSGMDISEKRRPQDGAFLARLSEGTVSFRVASAGVLNGEKLSIRILNKQTGMLGISQIGLTDKQCKQIQEAVQMSSGMILLCGPTGSGKTTTLYASLNEIDFFTHNVVTVEDPIEYTLANTSQIEVNPKAEITFATALRSILRQDPDVICVGEIRDEETASIALRASQTGHLVLATIHSNNNMSTLVRLIDLGISPMLLASALSMIVSQRLVRKLCEHCKKPFNLSQAHRGKFAKMGVKATQGYKAVGCEKCRDTGYKGRMGLYDILVVNEQMKAAIVNEKLSLGDLKKHGETRAKSVLLREGVRKIAAGITTFEEVKRVTANIG